MEIKVLGPGCAKCKTTEKAVQEAVNESGKDITITKVDDVMKIMEYGVMRTPAIVVNEKVVSSGKVPSKKELDKIIENL
ncbi:MAG: thioredoxin family protein [Bacteroidales bacterium]